MSILKARSFSSSARWLHLLVASRWSRRVTAHRGDSPWGAESVMSRHIIFRLSAPDADSSLNLAAFQECECHGFLLRRTTAARKDNLRPGDRLCHPGANWYTFYALRLVCRYRSGTSRVASRPFIPCASTFFFPFGERFRCLYHIESERCVFVKASLRWAHYVFCWTT